MRFQMTLVLFCCLVGVSVAGAQTPDTATIRGTVVDATQAPVSGARIEAHNDLTGETRVVEIGRAHV